MEWFGLYSASLKKWIVNGQGVVLYFPAKEIAQVQCEFYKSFKSSPQDTIVKSFGKVQSEKQENKKKA